MATAAVKQQASQSALVALLADPLDAAWATLLDVNDLEASLPQYTVGVKALVSKFGQVSAAMAARYYATERAEAGIRGTFTVNPTSPDLGAIDEAVKWATKGLWSETPDIEAAKTLTTGVAEKYVQDAGRSTLIDAVGSDRRAKGWARVVEPGACAFCLLLATRGAVYRGTYDVGGFRSHDHCRCHVEPVFNAYEPTAEIRQAQAIYQQVKQTARGPKAVRRAFRQAIESQSPTNDPGGQ